ncbi:MAG: cupin domain-containing protein [Gammaproteobacteria bacterium]|nr:cupin domain-containing protein [Gammaproteobacteria bacterium]
MLNQYDENRPYITKDGSIIRELMHPDSHGNIAQSLAEAVIEPGRHTRLHLHRTSEELYHVTRGSGEMRLADKTLSLRTGDTICIRPGTPHQVFNSSSEMLHILCCCAPAYSHEDTVLLPDETGMVGE